MAIKVAVPIGMEKLLNNRKDIVIDVRIGDYLTDEFFKTYTKFDSYGEFVEFSPYTDQELAKDSKLFETEKMDRYIELTTQFDSYASMFSFAVEIKLEEFVSNGGSI